MFIIYLLRILEVWILEAIEVARKAVDAASDKQASDIVLLDTRTVCSFADYFVICSGETKRQIQAIYEEVEHSLKKEGIPVFHHEGSFHVRFYHYMDIRRHNFPELRYFLEDTYLQILLEIVLDHGERWKPDT